VPDGVVGVGDEVAILGDDRHVGDRHGVAAARVAVGVAEGPNLMQVTGRKAQASFAAEHP
jgi:hypothetical protein